LLASIVTVGEVTPLGTVGSSSNERYVTSTSSLCANASSGLLEPALA